MKKLTALVSFAAFAVIAAIGTVVVSGVAQPVLATDCTNGTKYTDFTGSVSGKDTLTVQTKGGKKLCKDVKVNFTSYKILNDYNGEGFKNNPTALPQTKFYNKTVTLKKGTTGKTTVTVDVPDACTPYQIDAYIGPVQDEITTSEGLVDTNAIAAGLFKSTKTDCSEPPVDACNTQTGVIEKVAKGKENTAPHSTDMSKCKDVKVCDPATGEIITVKVAKQGNYKPTTDEACKTSVCDPATGDIKKVSPDQVSQYKPVTDEACEEEEEEPEVIAETGPAEVISAVIGTGSLAGAGTAYIRSRFALFRK